MARDATLETAVNPEGLDRLEVEGILEDVRERASLGDRIEQISMGLLGRPYVDAPLGGGADIPELFRVSLDGFDCVTYIEAIVALACSRTVADFVDTMRMIRYEEGKIDWFHRNHYMIDWARNNEANGLVINTTTGPDTVEKTVILDLIPGLGRRTRTLRYYPSQSINRVTGRIETGDLVLFVSEKETLDVFHTGVLLKGETGIAMRHATRTAGSVIEQDLDDFVNDNTMAGLILLRPQCRR